MNIGSVGRPSTYQPTQRTPEATEIKGAPDHDGDSDDSGASQAAIAPTVNTNGQTIGQLINAIA